MTSKSRNSEFIGRCVLLFVIGLVGVLGIGAILARCTFVPIEPLPKEDECITLRQETETTVNTTNTTSTTTTGLTTHTTTVETPKTVVETVDSPTTQTNRTTVLENRTTVKETKQTKAQTTVPIATTTISTTVETDVETTIEIPEIHDEYVKDFTHTTYYSSKYGSGTCGGSGRKLIGCNTTDEIKGSIASKYLYDNYGYNYNGKRTKVYLVVYNHPEMTGYYYLDDCCADPINTIDFFYVNTVNCPFQYDGIAGKVDCYICNY